MIKFLFKPNIIFFTLALVTIVNMNRHSHYNNPVPLYIIDITVFILIYFCGRISQWYIGERRYKSYLKGKNAL